MYLTYYVHLVGKKLTARMQAVDSKTVSVIKASQLTLYNEIIAICSEIHTKHINTLCEQGFFLAIREE
jgi:hypothetical protein